MKKVIGNLIFYVIIFCFCGCKNDSENITNAVENYSIPYAIGNVWTYNVTNYQNDGSIISSFKLVRKVSRDTIIQNSRWFVVTTTEDSLISETIEQNINGCNYYWIDGLQQKLLRFDYPPVDSGKFFVPIGFGTGGRDTTFSLPIIVTKSSEYVNVSAGRFKCYLYTQDAYSFSWSSATIKGNAYISYLSPIGIIKTVEFRSNLSDNKISTVVELEKYSLNN